MCKSDSSSSSSTSTGELPAYGKFVCKVYHAIPKFNFPFTNLPFSFVLFSAAFLVTVRILSNKVLETVFGWPSDGTVTDRAASSIPAIVHSSLLCPGLFIAFIAKRYAPTEHISKASAAWQDMVNALLQFCTGYMLNDTIFLIYRAQQAAGSILPHFEFEDILFLGHHAVTSIYMTQTRVYKAGHMSAMMCMLLGELSNPLHNTYLVLELASGLDCCKDGPNLQLARTIIPPLFSAVYIFFRVIVGPPVLAYTTYDLLMNKQGRENLPLSIRLFWVAMIWAVMVGSIPEVLGCKSILEAYLTGQQEHEL
eukprot:scaffold6638_cov127-Cylindrotheca_fusiformis.AAC.20